MLARRISPYKIDHISHQVHKYFLPFLSIIWLDISLAQLFAKMGSSRNPRSDILQKKLVGEKVSLFAIVETPISPLVVPVSPLIKAAPETGVLYFTHCIPSQFFYTKIESNLVVHI